MNTGLLNESMRWVLLDEVLRVERGKTARSRARVPDTEAGPELLAVEMMAQTGALLVGAEADFRDDLIFAKIEQASFDRPLRPGEALEIEAGGEQIRRDGAWLEGKVRAGGDVVGRARFLLMNVGRLVPGTDEPITFHNAFMDHYKIREKLQ